MTLKTKGTEGFKVYTATANGQTAAPRHIASIGDNKASKRITTSHRTHTQDPTFHYQSVCTTEKFRLKRNH